MMIRKVTVPVLTMVAFPLAVFATNTEEGDAPQDSAQVLRRLETAESDEISDKDLRFAIRMLAGQVRRLNERLDLLEDPKRELPPAKSPESRTLQLQLDMGFAKLAAVDRELQRALRDVQDMEQKVREAQAQLEGRKRQAKRLQVIRDQLSDSLKQIGEKSERN